MEAGASPLRRKKAKKIRLFSFWEEPDGVASPWLKRAWQRTSSKLRTRSDLEQFKLELEQSGLSLPGIILCNCEMSGGNDISLIYPWVHVSSESSDIAVWLQREKLTKHEDSNLVTRTCSDTSSTPPLLESGRHLVQGSYAIVETLVPSQDILPSGEQLAVLLGFRTTDDNCVDTAEADEERSEEARSWRDWTGIGTLYCGLARLNHVQVECETGRVAVLDSVARFRVRHMSGYVTLYSCLVEEPRRPTTPPAETAASPPELPLTPPPPTKDSVLRKVAENKQSRERARRDFLAS